MRKVLLIIGTRPEAIKLIPVYKELKKSKGWLTLLVSTGQHHEMLKSIFDFFEVQPDVDLAVMTKNQSLVGLTELLLRACTTVIEDHSPDLIIVQGDTTTAMVGALAGFYKQVQIAHVEAGLRSYDKTAPFPEEVNRRMISAMADFHFAPTKTAAEALKYERVQGKIKVVGNTVIDSLVFATKKVLKNLIVLDSKYTSVLDQYERMILITGHRRESFGDGFKNICKAIQVLAHTYPKVSFVYPVHLNPNVRDVVFNMLDSLPNVFLINPVTYDDMVYLMTKSYLILTDSGGVQEEAPSLGKPVLIMREKTERPEGVKAGCSLLVGSSEKKIVKAVMDLMDNGRKYKLMARVANPYGKGDSSKKIVSYLHNNIQ
ncbi:MAG: UDP-N-acetylglucosamine 2-epimerase (non-hydrolyzing) [Cyclobacteriaceae bacterium]|nr:UDP-N-acetylglucosamine 2-epimerase (non-hydrolyzing) [Cyclobacteriaceae bacterium]UYN87384.1 MAG: UDP-N-acetylglucosamine 2-epimerase (non-hydrolyzing) [Cyclobacteriaceae bacterium]